MKFDVNKLLDLDYLNSIALQLNGDIQGLKIQFLKTYDLEMLKNESIENINSLFSQYNLSNKYILQYFQTDFITSDWEFAYLFSDDISYSSELRDSIKQKAISEIEQLNAKIIEINNDYQKRIDALEEKLDFINTFIRFVKFDTVITGYDIDYLRDLIFAASFSDEEKLLLSYNVVKYSIGKINERTVKTVEVDTSSFEKTLNDAYSSSKYKESTNEKIIEPTYSETILGYYDYHKKLFSEEGLGSTLSECMETAHALSEGIKVSIDSISKTDFCVEMASLLYELHLKQKSTHFSHDEIADILMDLGKLDRIYEENIKNQERKEELLTEINNDLDTILMLDFESSFKDRVKNQLGLLQIELKENFINSKRLNEIIKEYESISKKIVKIPEICKQVKKLEKLAEKIKKLISVSKLPSKNLTEDYYNNLYLLKNKVYDFINVVSTNGPDKDFDRKIQQIEFEVSKYLRVENTNSRITLKGFVLFDVDESNNAYVVSDLDPNNKDALIDKGILKNKLNLGYADYSNLIKDLLLYGVPGIMKDEIPACIEEILDKVFYDKNRKNATGMVRIRPLRNSVARFISQKILLKPNTEMHKQVVGIIQEILPNVVISPNEEFALHINFASALKESDEGSYDIAISRYSNESVLYKLFMANPDRTSFTKEELSLIKDIVNMSLDAYSQLKKNNENLTFDIIDKIGGKRTRG